MLILSEVLLRASERSKRIEHIVVLSLRFLSIYLRASERSVRSEHTVVLSLRFLYIHSNSPYPDSPNPGTPSTGQGSRQIFFVHTCITSWNSYPPLALPCSPAGNCNYESFTSRAAARGRQLAAITARSADP